MWPPVRDPKLRLQRDWRSYHQHPGYLDPIDRSLEYDGPETPTFEDDIAGYSDYVVGIGGLPFPEGEFPIPGFGRPIGFGRPPRSYQMSSSGGALQDALYHPVLCPARGPFGHGLPPPRDLVPYRHRSAGGRSAQGEQPFTDKDDLDQGRASCSDKTDANTRAQNKPNAPTKTAADDGPKLFLRASIVPPFPGLSVSWNPYRNSWHYGDCTLISAFPPNHDNIADPTTAQDDTTPTIGSSETLGELVRDCYERLNVREDASQAEIKKAYTNLAKMYHPDRNTDDNDTKARFQEITEAYNVLGDPGLRSRYDATAGDTAFGPTAIGRMRDHAPGVKYLLAPDGKKWFVWPCESLQMDRDGDSPYELLHRNFPPL